MNDQSGLLAAILANPDDDAPRLILADWLDEHAGDSPCGKCGGDGKYRAVINGRKFVNNRVGTCTECRYGRVSNGFAERAEFIRIQCELAPWGKDCVSSVVPGYRVIHIPTNSDCRLCQLRRREQELRGCDSFPSWSGFIIGNDSKYHRGFIESIRCKAADAIKHLDAIREQHPIREVTLTTWPDVEIVTEPIGNETREKFIVAMLRIRWPNITFHMPEPPHQFNPEDISAIASQLTVTPPEDDSDAAPPAARESAAQRARSRRRR